MVTPATIVAAKQATPRTRRRGRYTWFRSILGYQEQEEVQPIMKSPTEIDIRELVAPIETTLAGELVALLEHKGPPWIDDIRRRVDGCVPGADDHYYVAKDGRHMIAHAWYTVAETDPRLGLVGHIYTHPDYRRRGIAAHLLDIVMSDFLARGGEIMQLFTSTPFSIAFYEQLGFENVFASPVYHDADWYMRYPLHGGNLLSEWFHTAAVSMRHLRPGDLPQFCLLYNCEHRRVLKDRAQRVGLGLEAELAFIEAHLALAQGQGACCVLDNGETIVGIASLMRDTFPYQSHIAIFDFYVHEAFSTSVPALVEACLTSRQNIGAEVVYAVGIDDEKRSTLAEVGFSSTGMFVDHYRVGQDRFDCELFRFE